MSSSSTNKQPCLIDRPLLGIVSVGATAALGTPANLNTPLAAGLQQLCSSGSDGACVDSITGIATEAAITASRLLVFASQQVAPSLLNTTNCWLVGQAPLVSSTVGARTIIPLLSVLVPVPAVGAPDTAATESDKKNTALLLPGGWYLYAGSDVILQSGAGPARVILIAQGGLY